MAENSFPYIYIGCPVEVFNDPSESDRTLGLVMRAKSRSADIVAISQGGIAPLLDCWHEDDPRIETASPDTWEDPTRGIFRLSPGELERRTALKRLDRTEEILAEFAAELEKIGKDASLARRRGRPPKRAVEPEEASAEVLV